MGDAVAVAKAAGYDLIIAETAGIGQGDSSIVDLVDLSMYVMTSEFGAASQLEKIDMLDFADLVVVNKFEKRGGEDAVRDVRKQVQRNRNAFDSPPEEMPVFGTIASKFNDDGVTALYHALLDSHAKEKTGVALGDPPAPPEGKSLQLQNHHHPPGAHPLSGGNRRNGARLPPAHRPAREACGGPGIWKKRQDARGEPDGHRRRPCSASSRRRSSKARSVVDPAAFQLVREWDQTVQRYSRMSWRTRSGEKKSASRSSPSRCPVRRSPRSPCPGLTIPARFTAGCGGKTCPAFSLHRRCVSP
jgi:hypothetical protein